MPQFSGSNGKPHKQTRSGASVLFELNEEGGNTFSETSANVCLHDVNSQKTLLAIVTCLGASHAHKYFEILSGIVLQSFENLWELTRLS
jgi:hypothetical protein